MRNKTPFFTVIIPNYNHAPYLRERIDSVLNQTFADFELILLDDKSTDDSCTILRSYADNPRVTNILLNKENSGSTFKQWQRGFNLAKGEYIWIAESDDFADAHFLQTAYDIITKEKDVALLYFKSNIVNAKSEVTHQHEPKEECPYKVWEGKQFIKQSMLRGNSIINASSAIFCKKFLPVSEDNLYMKFRYCGDWLFWTIIASQGNVVRVNKYYNYFRMHTAKVTPKSLINGLRYIEGDRLLVEVTLMAKLSSFDTMKLRSLFYCDMLMDIYVDDAAKGGIGRQMKNTSVLQKALGRIFCLLKKIKQHYR
ncbi:MAG: glycosyltransferase family 2 protein [Prevotella sp.]|nr:glycosyltransferase family 2 protein [Prevotella sp.]